ncbi:hypothetical protein MKZ38_001245 [Zalerion maritima]|uniref:NADH dehydrogenase [ubiquinone] 1 alpha subcomplex subunit n=1 Tax=Zalerion maritima TaxID=339359 RepID=A0AAD5RQL4_9PEZI|nr:hypothetical protein MKZ38_001245 [Zalerion maritima]
MSTLPRTIKNFFKVGVWEYFHQMNHIGDTKAGTLIGIDKFGNKFFENTEELPLRTRWVDYAKHDYDAYVSLHPRDNVVVIEGAHIEPGWHAWISYVVDKAPTEDKLLETKLRRWETPTVIPNLTFSRGAYKPYSTTKPKLSAWEPRAAPRR